jgi:four helix bundle protein
MSKEHPQTQEANHPTPMRLGNDIAERLLNFAIDVIRVVAQLPKAKDPAARHVASQLIRSATSGGANYEEARAAESRDDFVHKVGIAAKEVRESSYWLRLIQGAGWAVVGVGPAIREAGELAAILGASARTARTRPRR